MLRARQLLGQLRSSAESDNSGWIDFAGTQIKQADLHRGYRLYDCVISCYLTGQIVERLENTFSRGKRWDQLASSETRDEEFAGWFDIGGCLCSGRQLKHLFAGLTAERIRDVEGLQSALREIFDAYGDEQWQWTWETWLTEIGKSAADVTVDDLLRAVEKWHAESTYLTTAVMQDASEDLALAEMWDADRRVLSKLGDEPSTAGTTPSLVATLQEELAAIGRRAARLKRTLVDEGTNAPPLVAPEFGESSCSAS
jgi:hypothetical protein